jgi:hypothetical protein
MSSFSPAQGYNLINAFWKRVFARCPIDGAAISSHLYRAAAGGYLLVLACSRCGKKVQVTRFSDPKRQSFRRWTPDEKAELAAACAQGSPVNCPVCQARIYPAGQSAAVMVIECPRCGNVQESYVHEQELIAAGV